MAQLIAAKVRRRVLGSSDRFWRVEDFDGPPAAVDMALLRLAADGELERVRRGVYWRGRRTSFGMTTSPPVQAVREVIGKREAVGAAEWYATNVLGLSTQVSPVPVVAVSRRVPTGLPNVRLVNRASRTGRREAHLNEMEVTILEALEGWEKYVELDPAAAVERFEALLRRTEVRVDRLARASRTESARVRERLRYLLRHAGWQAEAEQIEGARRPVTRDHALAVLPRPLDR